MKNMHGHQCDFGGNYVCWWKTPPFILVDMLDLYQRK
jgi:hypothetical protein